MREIFHRIYTRPSWAIGFVLFLFLLITFVWSVADYQGFVMAVNRWTEAMYVLILHLGALLFIGFLIKKLLWDSAFGSTKKKKGHS